MSGLIQIRALLLFSLGLTLAAGGAWAQEPQEPPPSEEPSQPTPPKPAARGIPGLSDEQPDTDQNAADAWRPDSTPATGLEAPTLGAPSLRHSYWVPGLQYGLTLQSNPFGSKNSGWYATNFFGGNLTVMKEWSGSTFGLNISSGGDVTSQSGEPSGQGQQNGWYQQLQASQSFLFHRWSWQWSDQFAYLPETQFGFGAGTGLALPGVGGSLGTSLGGGLAPNQSILSAQGPRYSNSFILQGTYQFSSRQSITVAGQDGLLHFTQAQNVNSDNYLGSVGYNYALSKQDSLGVSYRFGAYHFPGEAEAYGDSAVGATYQRKITQRLALKLFAGPDFISYRMPLTGHTKQTSTAANANLAYAFKHGTVTATYQHSLTGGSGILVGGELNQVTFTGARQLNRIWSGSVNFGFARNSALQNTASVGFGSYDNYFVGAGINRPLGRQATLALSYNASIQQVSQQTGCTGLACGANSTQHTVTLFLNWHARPFVIE